MKLLHVVFSTNRVEFLKKTFEANKKLDFSGLDVDHLFIDDYPLGRDNDSLAEFVVQNGYNEIIFHQENQGITKTWKNFSTWLERKTMIISFIMKMMLK